MYILIDVTVINSRSRLSTHPSLTNAITPNNSNVISPQCPRSGGLFVAQMARRRERIFFFFRSGSNFAFYRVSSFNPLEFLFETVDNKRGKKMDEGGEKFELERQGNIGFLFFNQ